MGELLSTVTSRCRIQTYILEENRNQIIIVDVEKRPFQQYLVGKGLGDTFTVSGKEVTYRIDAIEEEAPPPPPPPPPPPQKPMVLFSQLRLPRPDPPPPLTAAEVEKRYGVHLYGRPRGVYKNREALLLISVIPKNREYVYHDGWTAEGDFVFSGIGVVGDQELIGANWLLAYGRHRCYLLIREGAYYYSQGEVVREGCWYEMLADANGVKRKEYRFRFRPVSKIGT